ncbi:MFS transporter [Rhodoplanes roseus]|uniref:MFS transporter n=1 Tax=Rhodoplanes roseus TaxID=29409 RepID=A0A327KMR9_9BRAD|nr:MFS transporter [Rhodoplanes roseus]RAI38645.1 MFS transporter [Rhodoplanes roseus]
MQSPSSSTLLARGAIIATAAIFGLTYSLSAALIALDLAERGLSEALIGANAAMHAVGVLVMAVLLPRLTARLGLRRAVIGSLLSAALLLCLFPALPLVWLWFPLRILLGAASEVLFVLSETWLNALSSEATRARTMAAYTAAMSVGFALGPLLLSLVGSDGFLPYAIGAALAGGAAAIVVSPSIAAPDIADPGHGNPLHSMRLAPVAMAATALNAAVETAGLTFLTLYAMSVGWEESQATQLMTCMMAGAIVLQLPIGWLGDKIDRQTLIVLLAALSAAGAVAWPWALEVRSAIYPLLFVWGGLFVGIYTIMLTIVGSRFSGSAIIGIYAGMGVFWGVGALIGPTLAGIAMQATTHGLVVFVAVACATFTVAAWVIGRPQRDRTTSPAPEPRA